MNARKKRGRRRVRRSFEDNHRSLGFVSDESIKRPGVSKKLLLEYKRNGIENSLALFPICPVWFSNLLGYRPVELGAFLVKVPFETCISE